MQPKTTEPSDSGVYLPTSSSDKSLQMTVISSGPDCKTGLGPGDRVVVNKYTGAEVFAKDEKFFLVKEIDILAKIEEAT